MMQRQSDFVFFRNSDWKTCANDPHTEADLGKATSKQTKKRYYIFYSKSSGNINGKKVHLNQIKRRSCFFYRGSTYSPNE